MIGQIHNRQYQKTRVAAILRFLCFLILLCSGVTTKAVPSSEPNDYVIDLLTTDNGLPQNSVNAILQTKDGYLWLATFDGLARYDGIRFVVFTAHNTAGVTSNRFTSLYEDRSGDLWDGTEDAGVIRYHNGKFTAFKPDSGLEPIEGVVNDHAGNLVVITTHTRYRLNGDALIPFSFAADKSDSDVVFLGRKVFFGVKENQLYVIQDGRERLIPLPPSIANEIANERPAAVFIDKQGTTWVSTEADHLAIISGTSVRISNMPAITSFYEDTEGNLWMGVSNKQLFRYANGVFTDFPNITQRLDSAIGTVYQDGEGTLWLGTQNHGLCRLRKKIVTAYSESSGIPSRIIYPIYQDRAGTILLGADRQDLVSYKNGVFSHTSMNAVDPTTGINLHLDGARALFEDADGRLWIGTDGVIFSLKNGRLSCETDHINHRTAVWVIFQDNQRNLWFGAIDGLIKYRDGSTTTYTTKDGLPSDDVKSILQDHLGNLWFGTYGGLSLFKDGHFVSYTERDGLASNRIRSLYEDADGVIWIGTYDGGLTRFKDGKFKSYRKEDGLFDNGVFQILEDDRANLWMSCNRGIYRASKQQLNDFADGKTRRINCVSYGKEDGMRNIECNGGRQPGGIKAQDGMLWFPTQDGVAVIDPRNVPFNEVRPQVHIESGIIEEKNVDFTDTISVQPGEENLEIRYAAPTFIKPEHVRFRYQLIGVDRDWVDAGDRRIANYSHIAPGNYVFKVIAANSDGVWNNEGATVRVIILPHFWQQWWFITLCIVAVGTAIYLYYRQQVSQLEKRHALQTAFSRQLIESQENERTRIAAELHDGLGQSLLVIKNRALLGLTTQEKGNGASNQLDEISSMASQALSEVRTIARNLRPYQLDRLGLTLAVGSIVNNLSTSPNLKFTSEIDSIDNLLSSDGEINLYRIVQEAVNNIIKHSQASEAHLSIKRTTDKINVVIQDNGKGFNPENKLQGAGFGMLVLSERTRILGGKIEIQSSPGRGTTINLKIDLPDNIKTAQ